MEIFALLAGGLILLIGGGEVLVRGAIALAKHLGVPASVIGLTILAYGTSAPELVVSLQSAMEGHADMALGNVVGSNISNILLILGTVALLYPLRLDKELFKPDGLLLISVSGLLWVFALDGSIGLLEGIIFLAMLGAVTWYTFARGRKQGFAELEAEIESELDVSLTTPRAIAYTVIGLIVMILGGKLLVNGGVKAAMTLGVSEGVIGLTIIAVGTSLPELVTSILAARKGENGMAVGNVVGSNLINIYGIIGITAVLEPLTVDASFLSFDIPLMLGVTLLLVYGLWRGSMIGRLAGSLGVLAFIGYIAVQY